MKLETSQLPIVGAVPRSCDILDAGGNAYSPQKKPNYPFTEKLREIATNLECLSVADDKQKMGIPDLATEIAPSIVD